MFNDSEGLVTWAGDVFCHCPVAPRLSCSVFDPSASLCQEPLLPHPPNFWEVFYIPETGPGGVGRKGVRAGCLSLVCPIW